MLPAALTGDHPAVQLASVAIGPNRTHGGGCVSARSRTLNSNSIPTLTAASDRKTASVMPASCPVRAIEWPAAVRPTRHRCGGLPVAQTYGQLPRA